MANAEATADTVAQQAGAADAALPVLAIEVAVGLAPGEVWHSTLRLPVGANVADALRAAGVLQRLGATQLDELHLSVWGRHCAPTTALRANDRVELTRGLRVDPKEARRLRYRRDGLRKPQRPGKAPKPAGP